MAVIATTCLATNNEMGLTPLLIEANSTAKVKVCNDFLARPSSHFDSGWELLGGMDRLPQMGSQEKFACLSFRQHWTSCMQRGPIVRRLASVSILSMSIGQYIYAAQPVTMNVVSLSSVHA